MKVEQNQFSTESIQNILYPKQQAYIDALTNNKESREAIKRNNRNLRSIDKTIERSDETSEISDRSKRRSNAPKKQINESKMAGLYRDPPIPYTRAFDSSKPKLVTLTVYNAEDQEDSVKVPLFTNVDLEELLHTEEAFRNSAEDLGLTANKYIKYFGRCLCVDAQTKWRALTRDQRAYPTTINGYTKALSFCYTLGVETWSS